MILVKTLEVVNIFWYIVNILEVVNHSRNGKHIDISKYARVFPVW